MNVAPGQDDKEGSRLADVVFPSSGTSLCTCSYSYRLAASILTVRHKLGGIVGLAD